MSTELYRARSPLVGLEHRSLNMRSGMRRQVLTKARPRAARSYCPTRIGRLFCAASFHGSCSCCDTGAGSDEFTDPLYGLPSAYHINGHYDVSHECEAAELLRCLGTGASSIISSSGTPRASLIWAILFAGSWPVRFQSRTVVLATLHKDRNFFTPPAFSIRV